MSQHCINLEDSHAYAAIRRADGRDYIDISSLSCCLENCKRQSEEDNQKIGKVWAGDNPIVAYATVVVRIGQIFPF